MPGYRLRKRKGGGYGYDDYDTPKCLNVLCSRRGKPMKREDLYISRDTHKAYRRYHCEQCDAVEEVEE